MNVLRHVTQIQVQYDCGFSNQLYIRGEGVSTLSWIRGVLLKNISPDLWIWETQRPFIEFEFKIVLNDTQFEQGSNRILAYGKQISIFPYF